MSSYVLIEHSASIFGAEGDKIVFEPHEDGLFSITYFDGGPDDPTLLILPPDMALALSSVIARIVSLNAKANP